MSFLLRAALVIGALSYLAAMRGEAGRTIDTPGIGSMSAVPNGAPPAAAKGSTPIAALEAASATWSALPPDARQRLAQEAVAEFGRRIGPVTASRDTLAEADRKAAWRGSEGR